MGCGPSKPCTTSTSKIPTSLPKVHAACPPSSSSAPSIHPNRLIKFEDEGTEFRLLNQIAIAMNRNMNSPLVSSEQESCRRPDPRTILFLTPKVLDEVEQAFVTYLSKGWLNTIAHNSACCSFKAVSFKKSEMKESQLGVAIIEAALTHIIDHLDEHPKLVAALGTAKIGYRDKGLALEDIGTRVFVVKCFAARNTT